MPPLPSSSRYYSDPLPTGTRLRVDLGHSVSFCRPKSFRSTWGFQYQSTGHNTPGQVFDKIVDRCPLWLNALLGVMSPFSSVYRIVVLDASALQFLGQAALNLRGTGSSIPVAEYEAAPVTLHETGSPRSGTHFIPGIDVSNYHCGEMGTAGLVALAAFTAATLLPVVWDAGRSILEPTLAEVRGGPPAPLGRGTVWARLQAVASRAGR